jgi:hypothetical protein
MRVHFIAGQNTTFPRLPRTGRAGPRVDETTGAFAVF